MILDKTLSNIAEINHAIYLYMELWSYIYGDIYGDLKIVIKDCKTLISAVETI